MWYIVVLIITLLWNSIVLGDTVKPFESGNSGVSTVSGGQGDPGGISYGSYQLASKTGTADAFVKQSIFKSRFEGLKAGTEKFSVQWKYLAKTQTEALHMEEWKFIKKTHFDNARMYANNLKLPSTPAIDEAIWSMSIQHGNVNKIILMAYKQLSKEVTEREVIHALYNARALYIQSLKIPSKLKQTLIDNRCKDERNVVLKLVP